MAVTPKQKNLIAYLIANPHLTQTECFEACGVPESTYYKWKKRDDYKEEYDRQLKEKWKDSERIAVEEMVKLAQSGHFQAGKYILDNLGYKPVEKIEQKVDNTITIEVNVDED